MGYVISPFSEAMKKFSQNELKSVFGVSDKGGLIVVRRVEVSSQDFPTKERVTERGH